MNSLDPEAGSVIDNNIQPKIINKQDDNRLGKSKTSQEINQNEKQSKKQDLLQKIIQSNLLNLERKVNVARIKDPIQKIQAIPLCRLDQQMCLTFKDQVCKTLTKFKYVLIPSDDQGAKQLRRWDLWGPFFMAITYLFFFDKYALTSRIILYLVIGAAIVSYNITAIGGNISVFQCFSILSYCIFPLYFANIVIQMLKFFNVKNQSVNKLIFFCFTIWCIISSKVFLGVNIPENKKFVAVYPAALFYIFVTIILAFS